MAIIDTHALQLPGIPFFYHEGANPYLGELQVTTHQQLDHHLRGRVNAPALNFLRMAIRRAIRFNTFCQTVRRGDTIVINTTALYKVCHTTVPKNLFDLIVCLLASHWGFPGQDDDTPYVKIIFDADNAFEITSPVHTLRQALDTALGLRFDHELDTIVNTLPARDSGDRLRYPGPSTNPYGDQLQLTAILQEGLGLNSHFILCKRQGPREGFTSLSQFAVQAKVSRAPERVLFSHGFPSRTTALCRELGSIAPWRGSHPHSPRGGCNLAEYDSQTRFIDYQLGRYITSTGKHP